MSRKYKLIIFISVILGVFLILLFIQNRYQQNKTRKLAEKEASQGLKADQQAFYGTYAVREPEKKLEALEKFVKDFPDSSHIGSARREIFKAVIKVWPDNQEKMLAAADRLVEFSGESESQISEKVNNYQFMARELLAAGIFLDDAERFASKSLETFDKQQFIEYQKKQYAEWQKDIPSDEEMDEKYRKELAAFSTTLGRIYLEKGRTAEGEKILLDAYEVDPAIAQAAIGLAEIAEDREENVKALDYLTGAIFTAGYGVEDARKRLETLYRKTHNGTLDGMETMLDSAYKRISTNPVKVEKYLPSSSRSERVVLAEFYTGAG